MKTLLVFVFATAIVAGCASNPLLTGKPQDWQGKSAADLKIGLGEPTKVIPQSDQSEIWEYRDRNEFVSPKEESTSFHVGGGGGGGAFGASGGISTVTEERRLSQQENVFRFRIKNGKVKGWYAARIVDGRVVWDDH